MWRKSLTRRFPCMQLNQHSVWRCFASKVLFIFLLVCSFHWSASNCISCNIFQLNQTQKTLFLNADTQFQPTTRNSDHVSLKLRRLRGCPTVWKAICIYRVLTHFWSTFTDHERKTSLSYRWVFNLLKTLILHLEVELRVTFTKSPKSSNELNFELRVRHEKPVNRQSNRSHSCQFLGFI